MTIYTAPTTSGDSNHKSSYLKSLKKKQQAPRFVKAAWRRLKLAYFRYEVTFCVCIMTPGEKLVFNSIVLAILSLLVATIFVWIPQFLAHCCCGELGCRVLIKNSQIAREVSNALATTSQAVTTSMIGQSTGQPTGWINETLVVPQEL